MRTTRYKLNAKRIINENTGSCMLASFLLIIPRLVFVAECGTLGFFYHSESIGGGVVALGVTAAFLMLLWLDALFIPAGELILVRLIRRENTELWYPYESERFFAYEFGQILCGRESGEVEESVEEEESGNSAEVVGYEREEIAEEGECENAEESTEEENDCEYAEDSNEHEDDTDIRLWAVFGRLRAFGFANLLRLRIRVLIGVTKDAVLSALPTVILGGVLVFYASLEPLPVSAFAIMAVGLSLMCILSITEIILEYNKYRFVYACLPAFNTEPSILTSAEIINLSSGIASARVGAIRSCEVSFWPTQFASLLLSPLVFPLLYLIPYKKLAIYDIGEEAPQPEKVGAIKRLCDRISINVYEKTERRKFCKADTAEIKLPGSDEGFDTVIFNLTPETDN